MMCVVALFLPGLAQAHTLDSWDGYRLEIGWENNPPYTDQLNAILLHVSPLVPGLDLEEQPFENGVAGLEKTLKIQLTSRDSKITLLLDADREMPGLYRAYSVITKAGYYQANIVGDIEGTPISLSMHPPQVRDTDQITFPETSDGQSQIEPYISQLAELDERLSEESSQVQLRVDNLESGILNTPYNPLSLAALTMGVVGVGMGGAAIYRAKHRSPSDP